jgi:hypothetical protein
VRPASRSIFLDKVSMGQYMVVLKERPCHAVYPVPGIVAKQHNTEQETMTMIVEKEHKMELYLLFCSHDTGDREDWCVFYTTVEAYSSAELRQKRQDQLSAQDPDLEFHHHEIALDQPNHDG